jgi:uncharacterized membrane protein (UPF0136 family)
MSPLQSIRWRAIVLGALLVPSAFAVQWVCAAVGIPRESALWIWAALYTIFIAVLLGPILARLVGTRKAVVFGVLILAATAGLYAYVVYVMLPQAITKANEATLPKR